MMQQQQQHSPNETSSYTRATVMTLDWARVTGDLLHYCTLASAGIFAVAVGWYGDDPNSNFFDAKWKENAFCVTNLDVPYWTSHDVCFYVDCVLAVSLGMIFQFLKRTPGMEKANLYVVPNMLGTVAHGIGHGAVARMIRSVNDNKDEIMTASKRSFQERWQQYSTNDLIYDDLPQMLFWLGLLYASMPQSQKLRIVILSTIARVGQYFVPNHFAFTYVQTILLLAFSLNQLNLPMLDKDFSYALYPLVVSFPVTLIGWIESTQCRIVDKLFYGHVVYDGYIAVSVIIWYLLVYVKASFQNDTEKVKSKTL
jgi:hypothetical protein